MKQKLIYMLIFTLCISNTLLQLHATEKESESHNNVNLNEEIHDQIGQNQCTDSSIINSTNDKEPLIIEEETTQEMIMETASSQVDDVIISGDGYILYTDGHMIINKDIESREDQEYPWTDYSTKIKNLEFTNNVTYIPDDAFIQSQNLTEIKFSNSIEYIGSGSFNFCNKLTELTIPGNVKKFDIAFCDCKYLQSVTLENGIKEVSTCAFSGCINLRYVNLPNSLERIEAGAFKKNMSLRTLYLPYKLSFIGHNAFDVSARLLFLGDAPICEMDSLSGYTIYYPIDNVTWNQFDFKGASVNKMTLAVNKFSDIHFGNWYDQFIQFVAKGQIMTGYSDRPNIFGPYDHLTRAMMVQIIYNIENKPEVKSYSATNDFSDVNKGDWYENAVNWAYENKIISGYEGQGKFGPNDPVTREQVAVIMHHYGIWDPVVKDVSQRRDISDYIGYNHTSDWAKDTLSWAVDIGLISGKETIQNGITMKNLDPQGYATRAEIAAMIYKYSRYYGFYDFVYLRDLDLYVI